MIAVTVRSHMPNHILVVDDDTEILDLLTDYLSGQEYRVRTAHDGTAMDRILSEEAIDLILLDLTLPGEGGLDIAERLRRESGIPIIMLTGRGAEADKVTGLEVGADDYISKPFSLRELKARIGAVLRRSESGLASGFGLTPRPQIALFEGWTVDLGSRAVTSPQGVAVSLTSGQFDLLTMFLTHPGRVLSRDQILDLLSQGQSEALDRSIDIQVSRLRHAIEANPRRPRFIRTIRNAGYIFSPGVEWRSS